MSFYREGDLVPHECEVCDCAMFEWNGASSTLKTDPPSTCICACPAFKHRFRPFRRQVTR